MKQDSAETLAIQALGWIAADDDIFTTFLSASGAAVADLRALASDPAFLAAVLDFLLQDDKWVQGFAAAAGISPELPIQAAAVLAGPGAAHWT
ncbi:DUF3572 domain-containing protein [Phaeovulum sp.]|uniref:DUF3572 domain-containing protein n=1 Tax=Phaeovulum sp. TaxID=2934796 RepID=UPI0035618D35